MDIKLSHFDYYGGFVSTLFMVDYFGGDIYKAFNFKKDTISIKDIKAEVEAVLEGKLRKVMNNHYVSDEDSILICIRGLPKEEIVKDEEESEELLGEDDELAKDEYSVTTVYLHSPPSKDMSILYKLLSKYCAPKPKKTLPTFNLISMTSSGPKIIKRNLKKTVTIDYSNSYNLDCDLGQVVEDFKTDTAGLIVFAGDPGTGKTTLIKYLSQEIPNKKFYFISNSSLSILSDPKFITFCLESLQDGTIVLEDCERALLSRDVNASFDISSILNITDGILGDLMNIKIVATLNTHDKIDTALLRKGRLIRKVEFRKLKPEQVLGLAKSIGKTINNPREMTLSEVYNIESNGVEIVEKVKIGF